MENTVVRNRTRATNHGVLIEVETGFWNTAKARAVG